MTPMISVVVLLWNGEQFVDACLTALRAQNYDAYEIIVVDNASEDRSIEKAAAYEPDRLIRNEYNAGYAGGNNVGIEAASGDIVVLLNQDTEVQTGWLSEIAATFDRDSDIGIVGCKSYFPGTSTIQHAGGVVDSVDAFTQHTGHGEEDTEQYDELTDVQYVTGAAFAMHRRVIETIGTLDDGFNPAFYEEIDYCFRARRAGFRVVCQPEAILYHHETSSLPEQSYARVVAFQRNRIRFILRHWDEDALRAFVDAEYDALYETRWLDDAIARARAYWDNLLFVPLVCRHRRDDETLGPPLSESTVTWLLQTMKDLRQHAHDRVRKLVLVDVGEPAAGAQPALNALKQADLATLQNRIEMLHNLRHLEEHQFASDIPVIGPLIARFRELWLSVAARWYMMPVIHQQNLVNEHIAEALRIIEKDARRWQTLNAEVREVKERLRAVETVETILQADDAETSTAIHALTTYLTDK